jgi:hypothetical protein
MLVKVFGSAVFGVEATTITVEVNIDKGVGYHLVGLPDNAIKESSYRIAAALKNNGYSLPGKKITINMAPADLRKEGSAYDLTLAIGILAASGQIRADVVDQYLIMGELSLDGGLQPIKGALSIAIKAKEEGFKGFFLPIQNVKEAAIVSGLDVYGVENVTQVIDFFEGNGTSYACPLIASSAAQLLQLAPKTQAQKLKTILMLSAHQYHKPDKEIGAGVPNLALAARMISVVKDSIIDVSLSDDDFLHLLMYANQKQKAKITIQYLSQDFSEKHTVSLEKGLNRIPMKINKKRSNGLYHLSVELADKNLTEKFIKH